MKQHTQITNGNDTTNDQVDDRNAAVPHGGLPVQTDLRAGLAWDEIDDQTADLWEQVAERVNGMVSLGTDSNLSQL